MNLNKGEKSMNESDIICLIILLFTSIGTITCWIFSITHPKGVLDDEAPFPMHVGLYPLYIGILLVALVQVLGNPNYVGVF